MYRLEVTWLLKSDSLFRRKCPVAITPSKSCRFIKHTHSITLTLLRPYQLATQACRLPGHWPSVMSQTMLTIYTNCGFLFRGRTVGSWVYPKSIFERPDSTLILNLKDLTGSTCILPAPYCTALGMRINPATFPATRRLMAEAQL